MPKRYHTVLVVLHWLLALLLIGALVAGKAILNTTPNSNPAKLLSFQMHMGLGLTILILMLVRVAVRLTTSHPAPVDTGNPVLNRLAPLVHWALYLLALGMAVSGVALSRSSGLPDAVFGDGALPPDFSAYPARAVHGVLSNLLALLIAAHVAAALWHQFLRRDGLMARMGFGPRH